MLGRKDVTKDISILMSDHSMSSLSFERISPQEISKFARNSQSMLSTELSTNTTTPPPSPEEKLCVVKLSKKRDDTSVSMGPFSVRSDSIDICVPRKKNADFECNFERYAYQRREINRKLALKYGHYSNVTK